MDYRPDNFYTFCEGALHFNTGVSCYELSLKNIYVNRSFLQQIKQHAVQSTYEFGMIASCIGILNFTSVIIILTPPENLVPCVVVSTQITFMSR